MYYVCSKLSMYYVCECVSCVLCIIYVIGMYRYVYVCTYNSIAYIVSLAMY